MLIRFKNFVTMIVLAFSAVTPGPCRAVLAIDVAPDDSGEGIVERLKVALPSSRRHHFLEDKLMLIVGEPDEIRFVLPDGERTAELARELHRVIRGERVGDSPWAVNFNHNPVTIRRPGYGVTSAADDLRIFDDEGRVRPEQVKSLVDLALLSDGGLKDEEAPVESALRDRFQYLDIDGPMFDRKSYVEIQSAGQRYSQMEMFDIFKSAAADTRTQPRPEPVSPFLFTLNDVSGSMKDDDLAPRSPGINSDRVLRQGIWWYQGLLVTENVAANLARFERRVASDPSGVSHLNVDWSAVPRHQFSAFTIEFIRQLHAWARRAGVPTPRLSWRNLTNELRPLPSLSCGEKIAGETQ